MEYTHVWFRIVEWVTLRIEMCLDSCIHNEMGVPRPTPQRMTHAAAEAMIESEWTIVW